MNSYNLIGTLCLLFIINLCFAQRTVEPTQFQIGLSNYSYFTNQYNRNLEDEIILETPFASRWGLSAASTIGDHFGLGLSLQYRRWQDETVLPIDSRLMIPYVPVKWRYLEFTHHLGLIDLYGRWYVQDKTARLRTYAQLGVGAEARFGGSFSFPMLKNDAAQTAQSLGFNFNGLLFSLGVGVQYRLTQNWGLECGLMAYSPDEESSLMAYQVYDGDDFLFGWPSGLLDRSFLFNQYGLQLGLFRTF